MSSLFNEISPSVSFPPVPFFSLCRSHSVSLFSTAFASSFPNIFARIDGESQPAGKYTSLLNKTLSGLGAECTARINGRESSRRGYIWEKCRGKNSTDVTLVSPTTLISLSLFLSPSLPCFSLRFHAHLLFSYSQVPHNARAISRFYLCYTLRLWYLRNNDIAIKPRIIKGSLNYFRVAVYIIGNRIVTVIRLMLYALENFSAFH